jgi:hypothetical protein
MKVSVKITTFFSLITDIVRIKQAKSYPEFNFNRSILYSVSPINKAWWDMFWNLQYKT